MPNVGGAILLDTRSHDDTSQAIRPQSKPEIAALADRGLIHRAVAQALRNRSSPVDDAVIAGVTANLERILQRVGVTVYVARVTDEGQENEAQRS